MTFIDFSTTFFSHNLGTRTPHLCLWASCTQLRKYPAEETKIWFKTIILTCSWYVELWRSTNTSLIIAVEFRFLKTFKDNGNWFEKSGLKLIKDGVLTVNKKLKRNACMPLTCTTFEWAVWEWTASDYSLSSKNMVLTLWSTFVCCNLSRWLRKKLKNEISGVNTLWQDLVTLLP